MAGKPETLYQKIVDTHTVKRIDDSTILLYVDIHFANEYTSPQAFAGLVERGIGVLSPDSHLCVVDHVIPTEDVTPRVIEDSASARQAAKLGENCRQFGIKAFYGPNDPHQGIEHVLMDEQGLVRPGMVVICGDSHTTTHGSLGALAFGIGTSEIEHILATQTLVYRMAKTMLIRIDGHLPEGVTAKDLALAVLRKISARGALGCVVEYQGSVVNELPVEGRMTLCNLTVEAGARGAIIAPDEKTVEWVTAHCPDLKGEELKAAQDYWRSLKSDDDAHFDIVHTLDASALEPMVTWGTSPDQAVGISESVPEADSFADPDSHTAAVRAQGYQGLEAGTPMEGIPVQHVFIGSCTNGRLEDFRAAADIIRRMGGKVSPTMKQALAVPGSGLVKAACEAEGIDQVFRDAGWEWREPGCSMCLAMNADKLNPGDRCASTSNRNFEGRQGKGSRTHLMSPAMAAAAAMAGHFVDIRDYLK